MSMEIIYESPVPDAVLLRVTPIPAPDVLTGMTHIGDDHPTLVCDVEEHDYQSLWVHGDGDFANEVALAIEAKYSEYRLTPCGYLFWKDVREDDGTEHAQMFIEYVADGE